MVFLAIVLISFVEEGRNMAALAARGSVMMAVADDFYPPPRSALTPYTPHPTT